MAVVVNQVSKMEMLCFLPFVISDIGVRHGAAGGVVSVSDRKI